MSLHVRKPSLEREMPAILARYEDRTPVSRKLHREAKALIPGGVNRNILYVEPHPLYLATARGAHVFDEDGNRYLDCIGNYTTMVIGHSHPAVIEAVIDQAKRGTAWTAGSAAEITLARRITERVPSMENIKFTSSGTEATFLAVRAARAHTGRSLLAKFEGGYHGLHDYAMVSMSPALDAAGPADAPFSVAPPGIPNAVRDSVVVLPFNDLQACRNIIMRHRHELAAILVEPVPGVAGVLIPDAGFLQGLRELADEVGCLLIFDEVISFRVHYSGAQGLFGVAPDLTAMGKIIGGGYPIGAVGGRADVMSVFSPAGAGAKVVISGTFHANPVILAAGIATLDVFTREAVESLNSVAAGCITALQKSLAQRDLRMRINAIGSLFNFHTTREPVRSYRDSQPRDLAFLKGFYLALLNEGVMLTPRGMGALSTAMSPADITHLVTAVNRVLDSLDAP